MNKKSLFEPDHARPEPSIHEVLNAVDRSEIKSRALIVVAVAGVVALAIWLDAAVREPAARNNIVMIRAVAVIVAMITLATVKLRNEMSKNTQAILRAIAALDPESRKAR